MRRAQHCILYKRATDAMPRQHSEAVPKAVALPRSAARDVRLCWCIAAGPESLLLRMAEAGGAGVGARAAVGPAAASFTVVPPAPGQAALSDDSFRAFYESLDEFLPTIPDGLTEHYLQRCGFTKPDERLVRLISLAAQQFVADVAVDAHACVPLRASAQRGRAARSKPNAVPALQRRLAATAGGQGRQGQGACYLQRRAACWSDARRRAALF